jgi:hypothetical protein
MNNSNKNHTHLNDQEKDLLKEKAITNLEEVLYEVKSKLPSNSVEKDAVLQLIGRLKEINKPEKLFEIAEFAGEKVSTTINPIKLNESLTSFFLREKNKIRNSLFHIISELDE